jgi:hypothetical protein
MIQDLLFDDHYVNCIKECKQSLCATIIKKEKYEENMREMSKNTTT